MLKKNETKQNKTKNLLTSYVEHDVMVSGLTYGKNRYHFKDMSLFCDTVATIWPQNLMGVWN